MSNSDRYRRLVHPLVSATLPASFLVPVSVIVCAFVGTRLPRLPAAVLVCLCTGLSAALFANLAAEERVRAPGRLRFALVTLACAYLLVSAFLPGPVMPRFRPGFENLWYASIGTAQWLFSTSFLETFRAREFLLDEMEGKTGNELILAIRDAPTLTASTLSGLARIRVAAFVFAVSLTFVILSVGSFTARLGIAFSAVVIGCFAFLPAIAALTSQYAVEHDLACEGFPVDERLRSARLRTALAMVALPLAAAALVIRPDPPLPAELLARFLSWLANLFAFKSAARNFLPQPDPEQSRLVEDLIRLRDTGRDAPGIDLSLLFDALKRFFLFAAPLAVIAFVIAPLFSKAFRAGLRERSFFVFLARKLRELASLLRFTRHKKEPRVRVGIDDLAPVREALAALTRTRRSRRKRREVGRMTRTFMKLIAWGTARSVPYTLSSAPGEYVRSLVPVAVTFEADLLSAGDTFEEALYSDRVLAPRQIADYENSIERIVASKASP